MNTNNITLEMLRSADSEAVAELAIMSDLLRSANAHVKMIGENVHFAIGQDVKEYTFIDKTNPTSLTHKGAISHAGMWSFVETPARSEVCSYSNYASQSTGAKPTLHFVQISREAVFNLYRRNYLAERGALPEEEAVKAMKCCAFFKDFVKKVEDGDFRFY